ncbi:hypothetical protein H1R20_g16391, partial [Candolleomyces eurysporus]
MTLAIYTKTEIDTNYLITYIQLYFVITAEVKIRLGSFIVCNLVNDVLNVAESAIPCPTSSAELAAAVALLNQKYAKHGPELLQQLWMLASPEPINLIRSAASSVNILLHNDTPRDL